MISVQAVTIVLGVLRKALPAGMKLYYPQKSFNPGKSIGLLKGKEFF
jgi:hypothetical protein